MKITRSAENGIVTLRPEGWLFKMTDFDKKLDIQPK